MIKDEYDVNSYSDSELYDILDLVNPSDNILEAKIIQMINRYSYINNESGKKLTLFFKNIYDRFFYDTDNEDEEIQEGFISNILPIDITNEPPDKNVDISNVDISINSTAQINNKGEIVTTNPNSSTTSLSVNQLSYKKDKLNPLLKQTIKRIISIDSQYRDRKYPLSTNFTFNLSEPLKDVVSLSLYSTHIPYSWYTVSNNYGGNFFYLKGNTEGINTGNFDYKIEIPSGNYSSLELSNSISTSITTLKNTNTDISFGLTSIRYDNSPNKMNLTIDIKNNFNETNYTLIFENDPSLNQYPLQLDGSNIIQLRYNNTPSSSLSSYLGFNSHTYNANCIVSVNTELYKLGSQQDTLRLDTGNSNFNINSNNNKFSIVWYNGPSFYDASKVLLDASKVLLHTEVITLTISGNKTRNQIIENLNLQLRNNEFLQNSYIIRTDISGINLQDNGSSYFSMYINWNKKKLPHANTLNAKTAIIFPNETSSEYRIWTIDPNGIIPSQNICFPFLNTISELNNITAETYIQQTNYVIETNPYIFLKCIAPGYSGYTRIQGQNINYSDVTSLRDNDDFAFVRGYCYGNTTTNTLYGVYNDYLIHLPNSSTNGYSLNEYLSNINTQMNITNTYSIDNSNPNGVFNLSNMGVFNNSSTQNKILFRFDINKYFKNDSYYMDLSNSYLYDTLNLGVNLNSITTLNNKDGIYIDLNSNNVFTSTIQARSFYIVNTPYLAVFYPKPDYKSNYRAEPFYITPLSRNAFNSYQFANMIKRSFQQYQDTSGSYPFSSTTFDIKVNTVNNTITITLNININKILSENDYKVYFYDPSSVTIYQSQMTPTYYDNSLNTWITYLKMSDISYNLSYYNVTNNSYSDIYNSQQLLTNTYKIIKDTHIYLIANTEGVATNNGANNFTITIPAAPSSNNYQYTLQEIYDIINAEFNKNKYTEGSFISTIEYKNLSYVQFRLNINRIFTAEDYRIVFYDPYSFVKCMSGINSTSNVTWDSTLGWILGFRDKTEYLLSDYVKNNEKIITLTADTVVTTNIYNYFLIILDDYTQSHLNDGLVTLTPQQSNIFFPSYANRSNLKCDPSGNLIFTGESSNSQNKLTQSQIYSVNQIINAQKNSVKTYSNGPFIQDIFGLIPLKVAGLTYGSSYIEFSGTLQNQERTYFGPVNIQRMTIKLITDRGDTIDLNGSNWSFSFVCEQLYQQNSI